VISGEHVRHREPSTTLTYHSSNSGRRPPIAELEESLERGRRERAEEERQRSSLQPPAQQAATATATGSEEGEIQPTVVLRSGNRNNSHNNNNNNNSQVVLRGDDIRVTMGDVEDIYDMREDTGEKGVEIEDFDGIEEIDC
jgi:hypothetical protein